MSDKTTIRTDRLTLFGMLAGAVGVGLILGLSVAARLYAGPELVCFLPCTFDSPAMPRQDLMDMVMCSFRPSEKLPSEDTLPVELFDLGLPRMRRDDSFSPFSMLEIDGPRLDELDKRNDGSDDWLMKDMNSAGSVGLNADRDRKSGWGWLTDGVRNNDRAGSERRAESSWSLPGQDRTDGMGAQDADGWMMREFNQGSE